MDVVIFQVHDHFYGVHAETVRQVIEPQPVTPLPFMPAEVEGLVNVAGNVLPQVCAARRLRLSERCPEQGAVIVFTTDRGGCACRVSRVVAKAGIDPAQFTGTTAAGSAEQDALLAGEFHWGDAMVLLLNPEHLLASPAPVLFGQQETGFVAELDGLDLLRQENRRSDEFPGVVFSCAQELFAFRFDDVSEVVECAAVTPVPGAPAEMAGVMMLRGAPLPVFSMRAMLFGGTGGGEPFAVVVAREGHRFGLLVEQLSGIQRFASDTLRQLPEEQSLLEGFVTTPDGRMVALVRFSSLLSAERYEQWRPWLVAGTVEAAPAEGEAARSVRMLMFRIGRERMALPLGSIERVEEYFEPTGTPDDGQTGVAGVIQVRGNVIPVRRIEGGGAEGLPGAYLVVISSGRRCALPVDRIERVIDMNAGEIDQAHGDRRDFLSGIGRYDGMLVSLLNGERLVL